MPHCIAHRAKAEHPVLTLPEAARFLRLTPQVLTEQALMGSIPGRRIGSEWRFLKSALNDWLTAKPVKSNREAILSLVGKYKDDPTLNDILEAASLNRGRSMGRVDE